MPPSHSDAFFFILRELIQIVRHFISVNYVRVATTINLDFTISHNYEMKYYRTLSRLFYGKKYFSLAGSENRLILRASRDDDETNRHASSELT